MRTRNIVILFTALIIILTASIVFILFFNNPQTPIQYKNYTNGDISFKCPVDWDDYLYEANYGMTYSVDIKTRKQNSTATMTKIADYSIAVGDPKTVGFKDNTVPTTMMVISNTTSKIDTYPKGYVSWKMIESMINDSNARKSDPKNKFTDSTRNFTIDGEMAYEYTSQTYTSYSGMEYCRMVSFETRNSTYYTVYTIMCAARESKIENASRVFDEMIKSIKINN